MRKLISLLFVLLSFNAFSAGDDIVGYWVTEEKDSKLEVYKKDGKYRARILETYEVDGKKPEVFDLKMKMNLFAKEN